MMHKGYVDSTVEALILASPDPLSGKKIAHVLEEITPSRVSQTVAELNNRYAESGNSFRIRELAGGYQYYILPEYVGYVEELFSRQRKLRLTHASLETVAIVAYRQPVTKTEIEHIRGVASDGVIRTLMEKNLITITGRAKTIGKPLQYSTTNEFLKYFGLASIDDLPKMSEIEELISAEEKKSQTELHLEIGADGKAIKLNIADGTFDPDRRAQLEEDYNQVTESKEEAEPGHTLVLKKGSEENDKSETADSVDSDRKTVVDVSGVGDSIEDSVERTEGEVTRQDVLDTDQ